MSHIADKPEVPLNPSECTFSLKGEGSPSCSYTPTHHILWIEELPEVKVSNACDLHMEYVNRHSLEEFETHTFLGDCGMPGSVWHRPQSTEDRSYCIFNTGVPDDLSMLESLPAPVAESSL